MADEEPRTVWGLVIACAVAVIWSFLQLPSVIKDIAPQIGHEDEWAVTAGAVTGACLVVALVVWAVLYFAYVRSRAPERGALYFLILFGLCLAFDGGFIVLVKNLAASSDAQMKIADQDMGKALAALMDPNGGPVDMTVHATGEAGEVEKAAAGMFATVSREKVAYKAKLDALGIKGLMSPKRLAADHGLVHTRETLTEARAALKSYRQVLEGLSPDFHKRIQAAKLSDVMKRSVLEGFDAAISRDADARETIWLCEDGILAEFQKMAEILAHPKGRWVAKGDKILFANQSDLDAYQDDLGAVRDYQNQEQSVIATTRLRVQQETAPPSSP